MDKLGISSYFKNNPVRNKLIICFLLAALIPVLITGLISYINYQGAITRKISEYSLAQLTQAVANIQLKLAEFENISVRLFINKEFNEVLAKLDSKNGREAATAKAAVETYFNEYMISNSDLFALIFFDARDYRQSVIVTKDYYQDFALLIKQFKKQSAYQQIIRASGGIVWSAAIKVNRSHFVILGREIKDMSTGQSFGVLAMVIDEEKMDRLTNMTIYNQLNISFDEIDHYSLIINNSGEIVSTPFKEDIGKNITQIMKDTRPLQKIFRPVSDRDYGSEINQGSFLTEINHKQTLVTFKTISSKIGVGGRSGWHLLSLAPASYLFAEVRGIGWQTALLGLLFGIVAVITAFYLSSLIDRKE